MTVVTPGFLQALVYQAVLIAHLFSFAFAIVLVAKADLAMLSGAYHTGRRNLARDARNTAFWLALLWISGLALIGMGIGFNASAIMANGKVFAKVTVVAILTLNGLFLHFYAFPFFAGSRGKITGFQILVCSASGAISSVSWLFASLFGVARKVAPFMSYQNFMLVYLLCLAGGLAIALTFARPFIRRNFTATA
ncbi:hypothetical protein [uncultured Thalassospira sp.]|jgi:hypothetical protein|uniref:hypothetical protein n=1 Tax=uncultured Thalassospira sp. TaxID=404382 RepID=UPI0030D7616F|tara:strand:- start:10294 stop:10875 length:582 start_codon:yes stop_codon:yes gene_type:complete